MVKYPEPFRHASKLHPPKTKACTFKYRGNEDGNGIGTRAVAVLFYNEYNNVASLNIFFQQQQFDMYTTHIL